MPGSSTAASTRARRNTSVPSPAPRYLLDWRVLGFLAAAAVYLHNVDSAFNLPLDAVVPEGDLARGDLAAMLIHDNLGVAVGEEALFRGLASRQMIAELGPGGGLLAQAGVFSASHALLGTERAGLTRQEVHFRQPIYVLRF